MAEIINLDELVPEKITFTYEGQEYRLPGDLNVETTFTLAKLIGDLAEAELSAERLRTNGQPSPVEQMKALEEQRRITGEVEEVLLGLFQHEHPELEKLPFGVRGFQIVLTRILAQLGFGAEEEPPDPTPTPKKAIPKTRTSARSRSSRR